MGQSRGGWPGPGGEGVLAAAAPLCACLALGPVTQPAGWCLSMCRPSLTCARTAAEESELEVCLFALPIHTHSTSLQGQELSQPRRSSFCLSVLPSWFRQPPSHLTPAAPKPTAKNTPAPGPVCPIRQNAVAGSHAPAEPTAHHRKTDDVVDRWSVLEPQSFLMAAIVSPPQFALFLYPAASSLLGHFGNLRTETSKVAWSACSLRSACCALLAGCWLVWSHDPSSPSSSSAWLLPSRTAGSLAA